MDRFKICPVLKRVCIVVLLAVFICVHASAQRLLFDNEISIHFDNTEYAGSGYSDARTIFAVKITPTLEYTWDDKHAVAIGTELLKDFGSRSCVDNARLMAFYRFSGGKFGASAGIFERSYLKGRYSRVFFSDSTLVYHNLIQGIALNYDAGEGRAFAELAVDWEGVYSPYTREKFQILAAAGGKFAKIFDAGVSLSMLHYANKSTFEISNVVDNILINPYIDATFAAFFQFVVRLGYVQALQRDRRLNEGWKTPKGGEFDLRISKWGVFLDNSLYVGKSLMPFYHGTGTDGARYGSDLYAGDPFYATTSGLYNRTGIGYERAFDGDRVKVRTEMVLQSDGHRLYYQQLIGISARICPTLYDKSKHGK